MGKEEICQDLGSLVIDDLVKRGLVDPYVEQEQELKFFIPIGMKIKPNSDKDYEEKIEILRRNIGELFSDYDSVLKRNEEYRMDCKKLRDELKEIKSHWFVRLFLKLKNK